MSKPDSVVVYHKVCVKKHEARSVEWEKNDTGIIFSSYFNLPTSTHAQQLLLNK